LNILHSNVNREFTVDKQNDKTPFLERILNV